MNMWEAIVIIVAVTSLAKVMRAHARGGQQSVVSFATDDTATRETAALRRELTAVTERVKVLERIITDNRSSHDLAHEIDRLRER